MQEDREIADSFWSSKKGEPFRLATTNTNYLGYTLTPATYTSASTVTI